MFARLTGGPLRIHRTIAPPRLTKAEYIRANLRHLREDIGPFAIGTSDIPVGHTERTRHRRRPEPERRAGPCRSTKECDERKSRRRQPSPPARPKERGKQCHRGQHRPRRRIKNHGEPRHRVANREPQRQAAGEQCRRYVGYPSSDCVDASQGSMPLKKCINRSVMSENEMRSLAMDASTFTSDS